MGFHGLGVWRRLNGELLVAVDRDFERAVLPLMRLLWPQMIQPRGLAHYDKAGVDLVAFDENEKIVCAVQCKGFFKAEGLLGDHFNQISGSIAKFRKSELIAKKYILIHNQDGRNKEVAARIDDDLKTLVSSGKAEEAVQWNRHYFLKIIEEKIQGLIAKRVEEQSNLELLRIDRQFMSGRSYVADVPVSHRKLSLTRGQPPVISNAGSRDIERIADMLANAKGRWTILTGLFGSGKTTAALHAAHSTPNRILYVHAGNIEPRGGEGGTNLLMSRIIDALGIFGDFEEDERSLFTRLAGPTLRQFLMGRGSNAVLIIDALDENRSLAGPTAMTRFASALAELTCPIIMTTREEHFRATFGNYDNLFEDLSIKGGNMDAIKLLTLEPWEDRQIITFIRAAVNEAPENKSLSVLLEQVQSRSSRWDDDILKHPLFLRMIVDLAAEGSEVGNTRAQILRQWVWRKLMRDLKTDRQLPVPVEDSYEFIDKMETAMTCVSAAMITESENGIQLNETIRSTEVIHIIERVLGVSGIPLASAISVSLLLPAAIRYRSEVPIRFSHRSFQEYFLALHVFNQALDAERYPTTVKELTAEMRAESTAMDA